MAKNIEPTLKLISNYLKLAKQDYFFIPEYQRGYSWDITQCDKLWQDIEAFRESKSEDPYFFGTIIVDFSNENEFSLIDGQQRTTTFLLLLKALLLRITNVLKHIPDDEDSEALKAGLRPVCQPKHEPTDFEITYKSGCLGERNAKANHSS